MKGKIIIAFIITVFLLVLIPYDTVLSSYTVTTIGFEGYVAGSPYDDGFMKSDLVGAEHSNFAVSSTNPRTGTRCFRHYTVNSYLTGYWNLTYSSSSFLTNFSMWFRSSDSNIYFFFYNNTLGITNGVAIKMIVTTAHYIRYYNEVDAVQNIDTSFPDSTYVHIFWSINDTSGDVYYYGDNTGVLGVARNGSVIANGYKIDRIYFSASHTNTWTAYDDLSFTISSSYTEGSTENLYCGNDVSDYIQIGDIFGTSDSDQVNSPELFEYHNVPRATQIKGVALKVNIDQYTDDSSTANYFLSVNGLSLGNPDCFSQASNGYDWILFWSCSVNINNETIAFVFNHTTPNSFGRYWQVCVGNYGQDLDGDEDAEYYYSDMFMDCGWQWFGGIIPWWVCSGYEANQVIGKDLAMSFFITSLGTTEIFDYDDSLGLHGWDYRNATGYIYTLGKSITCSYTLGDNAYDYQISLYRNGTNVLTSGFPTDVYYPSGSVGYTPFTIGVYKFQLNSTHAVYNITAYVIGTLPNFYIFTNPVITNQYSYYSVYYKYYHHQNYDGFSTMFKILDDFPDYYSNDFSVDIFNNVSSNFTYYSTSSSAEYWSLFANKTNNYVNVGNLHKHFIRLSGISKNTINVVPSSMTVSSDNLRNCNFTIFGQHTFIGTDVSIYVNNNFVSIVGDSQNYVKEYHPSSFGSYIVSLKINQNGTLVTLCNTSFVVISSDTPTSETETGILTAPYTYIAGAILTLLFIIIPAMAISKISSVVSSDMLKYVPVMSGIFGFIISCLVGFFPWYSIFGLILILVLVLAIMWQSNKT